MYIIMAIVAVTVIWIIISGNLIIPSKKRLNRLEGKLFNCKIIKYSKKYVIVFSEVLLSEPYINKDNTNIILENIFTPNRETSITFHTNRFEISMTRSINLSLFDKLEKFYKILGDQYAYRKTSGTNVRRNVREILYHYNRKKCSVGMYASIREFVGTGYEYDNEPSKITTNCWGDWVLSGNLESESQQYVQELLTHFLVTNNRI